MGAPVDGLLLETMGPHISEDPRQRGSGPIQGGGELLSFSLLFTS